MRRRLVLAILILGVLMHAAWLLLWLTAPHHRITAYSYERIQLGMTEEEVVNLLRAAPGNYLSEKRPQKPQDITHIQQQVDCYIATVTTDALICKAWVSDGSVIVLAFSPANPPRVVQKSHKALSGSVIDYLRHLLLVM